MKNKLRKIVVEGKTYLWILNEKYEKVNSSSYIVTTKLTVFLKNMKNTPLTIIFKLDSNPITGSEITDNTSTINLNRPHYVRKLIYIGLLKNWQPEVSKLNLENGILLLNSYDLAGRKCHGCQ